MDEKSKANEQATNTAESEATPPAEPSTSTVGSNRIRDAVIALIALGVLAYSGMMIWRHFSPAERGKSSPNLASKTVFAPTPFAAVQLNGYFTPADQIKLVNAEHVLARPLTDNNVKLWDIQSGEELHAIPVRGKVILLDVSRDGKLLATLVNEESYLHADTFGWRLAIWDLATKTNVRTLCPDCRVVVGMAFRPGGHSPRLLATVQPVGAKLSEVRYWNLDTGAVVKRHRYRGRGILAFHPRGDRLALYSGEKDNRGVETEEGLAASIRIFDFETNQLLREIPTNPQKKPAARANLREPLLFSPDGKSILLGDRRGQVSVWEIATGKLTATFAADGSSRRTSAKSAPGYGKSAQLGDTSIRAMSCTEDGKTLAVAVRKDIFMWDLATRKLSHRLRGHDTLVRSVAFAAQGKRLISAGNNPFVIVWDLTRPSGKASEE